MRTEQPQPKHTGFTTFNQKLTIVTDNHLTQKQFKIPQSHETRDIQAWQSRNFKKITQPRSLRHTVTMSK